MHIPLSLFVTVTRILSKHTIQPRETAIARLCTHPGSIVFPQGTQNLQVHRHMGDRGYGRVVLDKL